MSQQDVASCLGITKSSVALYESGDNVPDIKNLYKMSILFNVSADYIIGLKLLDNFVGAKYKTAYTEE